MTSGDFRDTLRILGSFWGAFGKVQNGYQGRFRAETKNLVSEDMNISQGNSALGNSKATAAKYVH